MYGFENLQIKAKIIKISNIYPLKISGFFVFAVIELNNGQIARQFRVRVFCGL